MPVTFLIFDLLNRAGVELTGRPLWIATLRSTRSAGRPVLGDERWNLGADYHLVAVRVERH
jgi:hypothetical protein